MPLSRASGSEGESNVVPALGATAESQSLSLAAGSADVAAEAEALAFFALGCFCSCCQRQSALVCPTWPGTEHSA